MKLFLGILFAAIVLIAYVQFEKRRYQRACPTCGLNVSVDVVNDPCPRCDTIINPLATD